MKPRLFLTAALLAAGTSASAAVFLTETHTFPVGGLAGAVPDAGILLTLSQPLAGSQIATLTEVRVGL